jgi:ribonuclease E
LPGSAAPLAADATPSDVPRDEALFGEPGAPRGEREGGRRRGRGRNRREGRDGDESMAAPEAMAEMPVEPAPVMAEPADSMPLGALPPVAAATSPQATEPPPVEAQPAAPAAQPFALPIDELRALAASAGLEWVNSDAERILVVQQAMASEPKPVHVPRAPRPRVVIDDGPLVLVETRKDLSQLKLPFEQQQPPAG